MIRTLLFDMGNVLVFFSHQKMCAQIGALCNRPPDSIRDILIQSDLQADFERGRITEGQFHRLLEQAVRQGIDKGELLQACSEIFELNAPMIRILDALRSQGYRLLLLSNTSVTHFEFIRDKYDVLERFDEYVVSYQVGAIKPEPLIFEAALRAIACDPNECFYTDDIAEYVQAGRSYGLQAEVFQDAATLIRQLNQRKVVIESGGRSSD